MYMVEAATLVALGLATVGGVWHFKRQAYLRKHRSVGYGWLLGWENGSIRVLCRLEESPAGYAGIPVNGGILLSWNGEPMNFTSGEGFMEFMNTHPTTLGKELIVLLKPMDSDIPQSYTMKSAVVQGPIFYEDQPRYRPVPEDQRHLIHEGLFFEVNEATGQVIYKMTRSLSDEAVDNVLVRSD